MCSKGVLSFVSRLLSCRGAAAPLSPASGSVLRLEGFTLPRYTWQAQLCSRSARLAGGRGESGGPVLSVLVAISLRRGCLSGSSPCRAASVRGRLKGSFEPLAAAPCPSRRCPPKTQLGQTPRITPWQLGGEGRMGACRRRRAVSARQRSALPAASRAQPSRARSAHRRRQLSAPAAASSAGRAASPPAHPLLRTGSRPPPSVSRPRSDPFL